MRRRDYLTTPNDVQRFCGGISKPAAGRRTVLCCSTRYKLETSWATLWRERDGAAVLWQNKLNREEHRCPWMYVLCSEEDGCYDVFASSITSARTARRTDCVALSVGFEDVRIYGEMRMDATKPEDLRMHITAKKPEMT
ncbi:MAG: hypothetical protein ACLTV6_02985 [Christensenellales bacterium]